MMKKSRCVGPLKRASESLVDRDLATAMELAEESENEVERIAKSG